MQKRSFLRLALAATAFAASAAHAQVDIDALSAMAGGITPGDTPGFPVTLSVPGSYRLTGNLATTLVGPSSLIEITATNVTLDLNGYTVGGPYRCLPTGDLTAGNLCTPGSDPPLIDIRERAARVYGGFVDGGGGNGIQAYYSLADTSGGPTIEDVIVSNNRGRGIMLSTSGASLRNITAVYNKDGVFAGSEAIVDGVRATRNNGYGVRIAGYSVANKVITRLNGGVGFLAAQGVVSQLHTASNGSHGYYGSAAVSLSQAHHNTGDGFNGPFMLTQSVTRDNGGNGFTASSTGSCYANLRSATNGGTAIAGGTGFVGTLAICP